MDRESFIADIEKSLDSHIDLLHNNPQQYNIEKLKELLIKFFSSPDSIYHFGSNNCRVIILTVSNYEMFIKNRTVKDFKNLLVSLINVFTRLDIESLNSTVVHQEYECDANIESLLMNVVVLSENKIMELTKKIESFEKRIRRIDNEAYNNPQYQDRKNDTKINLCREEYGGFVDELIYSRIIYKLLLIYILFEQYLKQNKVYSQ